jgi:hypothetical protein
VAEVKTTYSEPPVTVTIMGVSVVTVVNPSGYDLAPFMTACEKSALLEQVREEGLSVQS